MNPTGKDVTATGSEVGLEVAKPVAEQKITTDAACLPPLPPSPADDRTATDDSAAVGSAVGGDINSDGAAQVIGATHGSLENPQAGAAEAKAIALASPVATLEEANANGQDIGITGEDVDVPDPDVEMDGGAVVETAPAASAEAEAEKSAAEDQPENSLETQAEPKTGVVANDKEEALEKLSGTAQPASLEGKAPAPEKASVSSSTSTQGANGHANGAHNGSGDVKEEPSKDSPAPPRAEPRPKKYIFTPPAMGSEDDYEKLDMVGQGTYGKVYKARHKVTGDIVAMKQVKLANQNDGIPITAVREIKILRVLAHENVIGLKAIVTDKARTTLTMVIEYMDHDLTGLFHMHRKWLTESHIKCFAKQLIEGLFHCHSKKVLHRDIKGANMLVSSKGILKLADFGLARRIRDDGKYTNRVVTLWYRAPELLLGSVDYGPAVDMWSVGCILVEMYTGRVAFSGQDELEQLAHIFQVCGTPENCPGLTKLSDYKKMQPKKRYPPALKEHLQKLDSKSLFPPETLDLIKRLLDLDPEKRITAHEALEHDYFYKGTTPCQPSEIPNFPDSCHELAAKKQRIARDEHLKNQKNKKFKDNKGHAHQADPHRGQRGPGPRHDPRRNSRDRVDQHRDNRRDRRDQRGNDSRRWQDRGRQQNYSRTHNPEYQPPPRHLYRDGRNRYRQDHHHRTPHGYSHQAHNPDSGPLVTPDYSYKRTEPSEKAKTTDTPSAGAKRTHSQM